MKSKCLRFRLGLLAVVVPALLTLLSGCDAEERMVWSPDGTRAAVLFQDGTLCLTDTNGILSGTIASNVTAAAWLPTGDGLALVRMLVVSNWNEVARLVPQAEVRAIELLATSYAAVMKETWPLLESKPPTADEDLDDAMRPMLAYIKIDIPHEATMLYLRDNRPKDWEALKSLPSLETNASWSEAVSADTVAVQELGILHLKGNGPSGVPVVVSHSLHKLTNPRPSPTAPVLAFKRTDRLIVAPIDGGTNRLEVAHGIAGSYDWTPDGQSLVFASPLTSDWVDANPNLARIQRCTVVASNGAIDANALAHTLALAAFGFPPRVRCLPDGRVLFAGSPLTVPAVESNEPARFYTIQPDGKKKAGPVAVRCKRESLPADLRDFVVSPDGRRIAILGRENCRVWVLDLARGGVEEVAPLESGFASRTLPAWRGKDELYFAAFLDRKTQRADWKRWSAGAGDPIAFSTNWPRAAVDGLLEEASDPQW